VGFFLRTDFGNMFHEGYTHIPRGIPLGDTSSPGRIHAPGSATINRGTHSSIIPQPFGSKIIEGPQGSIETSNTSPTSQYSFDHMSLPFLVTLDFPDLSRFTNDPIAHNPSWSTMPSKLPSDIPKFDDKLGEDPSTYIMTYHLWCSSNPLMNDCVRLLLF
jgi:hypothetical protein